jgi:hypothetical protein
MKLKNIIRILFSTLLLSCEQQKPVAQDQSMYWEGNQVSKYVYDSLLRMHTEQFVRNYPGDTTATRYMP